MTTPPAPTPGVGNITNRGTTDATSGALASQLQVWSLNVATFSAWLNGMTDAVLEAQPYGYTADEVALLKSAVTDMATLVQVYQGAADLTPARDLSVFVKRLAGVKMVV